MKSCITHYTALALSVLILQGFMTRAGTPGDGDKLGTVPDDLVGFCRWTVQDRAVGGLQRVVRDAASPKHGTVYGGKAEDANIAWVAASAYTHSWSRLHQDPKIRDQAFFLLDSLAKMRADGNWDDGGLGAYFGLHAFAGAVYFWLETGAVDKERATRWRTSVKAAARDAMLVMQNSICNGQYANPEFYYLSGLALAGKICNQPVFTAEATRALHRYENVLWPGGGVAYFHGTPPQHGYQQMVTKSVVLYWLITRDPYGMEWLRRLAPYFVNTQHRSGLLTDAEHSWLKHSFYNPVNPAVPGMLAALLSDGRNRAVAEVAAAKRADNVANRLPSFLTNNPNWYNYQHTTYAATFLCVLDEYPLPSPRRPSPRRVFPDAGFQGVRSHWDDFTAATGMRQTCDSLAGAYIADTSEPMLPLHSALDGVFAEVLCGDRSPDQPKHKRQRAEFRCLGWNPTTHFTTIADVAASSCLSHIHSRYWNDMPWLPGERWALNERSDWAQIQHWAVWRDHLVGFSALRCRADGGTTATDDQARLRWRFAPVGRELKTEDPGIDQRRFDCGALRVNVTLLGQKGGFSFSEEHLESATHVATMPVLGKLAPWSVGDFVFAATDASPDTSDSDVIVVPLNEAAAAIMVEPDGKRAFIWFVSLVRHVRQHHLAPLPNVAVRVFERDVELTPPFSGTRATVSLHGGETAILTLVSESPIEPENLVNALSSGWGRGERRPSREGK
ncbi:MAG: hypothetical protein KAI66_24705 [Lentisphaeria bacterium]|nr:hypothetical protein [Lentisphaeria bacterium]